MKEQVYIRDIAEYDGKEVLLCGWLYNKTHKGRLYFKTNEQTRPAYIENGMKPFRPSEQQTLKNYYEVPPDVLEDGDELIQWALKAATENIHGA